MELEEEWASPANSEGNLIQTISIDAIINTTRGRSLRESGIPLLRLFTCQCYINTQVVNYNYIIHILDLNLWVQVKRKPNQ
jgi:hypothetical protein